LYPTDDEIQQAFKEEFENARQYAKGLTIVNLSSALTTANDKRIDQQLNDIEMRKEDDSSSNNNSTGNSTIAVTSTQQKIESQKKQENQKIGLINHLIRIGNYKSAIKLLEKLPQWYIATYVDVSRSICKSINRTIDSLYVKYNTFSPELRKKIFANIKCDEQFTLVTYLDYILPILCSIGPGLANNTILFTKLIRICIGFVEQYTNPSVVVVDGQTPQINETQKRFYDSAYTIINESFLPSISMLNMNPCISIELWNLLKLFPYEMRYCLYTNWRTYTYTHYPKLICVKAECQEKIKYLLKRLTKENVKIHGRQIGKLSHNNPIIICDYVSYF
jgi:THO complex subunit 2